VNARWGPNYVGEFDVVGVAVGTALVSGALSLVAPALSDLTGALAALAWAGWMSGAAGRALPLLRIVLGEARGAIVAGAGGALVFLFGPAGLAPFRALLLGLSLVPLWWVARRTPVGAV
jgi:hypothetical protein